MVKEVKKFTDLPVYLYKNTNCAALAEKYYGAGRKNQNFVYIGDSATDIPCMQLIMDRGGYTIGVFDPVKDNREKVYKLLNDGRLTFYAPADYTARSAMSKYLKEIIDTIAQNEKIKSEQEILRQPAIDFMIAKANRDDDQCEIL